LLEVLVELEIPGRSRWARERPAHVNAPQGKPGGALVRFCRAVPVGLHGHRFAATGEARQAVFVRQCSSLRGQTLAGRRPIPNTSNRDTPYELHAESPMLSAD